MALTEVAETIFQENLNQEQNNPEEEVGAFIQDRSTSTYLFEKLLVKT